MNAAAKSAAVNSIAANADAVLVAALAANVGDTNVGRGAAALAVALAANATKVASLQFCLRVVWSLLLLRVRGSIRFPKPTGAGFPFSGLNGPRSQRYYHALVLRIIGRPLTVHFSN